MRHMKKLNKKKLEILEVERIIKKKINNKCLNIIDINFKNTLTKNL